MRTNVPVGGFQMAKRRSPSFVLSLELKEDPMLFSIIVDNLEICRVMYNTILGKYLKLETQMKREKKYKKYIRQWKDAVVNGNKGCFG